MIGLVIVTHGRLAEEFVFAMEHVVGPQTGVAAVCIGPDDDMGALDLQPHGRSAPTLPSA